jgi:hypothetical protein
MIDTCILSSIIVCVSILPVCDRVRVCLCVCVCVCVCVCDGRKKKKWKEDQLTLNVGSLSEEEVTARRKALKVAVHEIDEDGTKKPIEVKLTQQRSDLKQALESIVSK